MSPWNRYQICLEVQGRTWEITDGTPGRPWEIMETSLELPEKNCDTEVNEVSTCLVWAKRMMIAEDVRVI